MDETDLEIIDMLEENGRASFTSIAEEIGVSEGTVRRRVQEMEKNGVIDHFTVKLTSSGVRAVVMVKISTGTDLDSVLENFPSSIDVKEVAGDKDLVLEFERDSNEEINEVLDEVRSVEGVEDTKTYTVLKQRKL
jgi:DNA-binding Lrp family transcriptional regulator